jgi:acyl-homoserine lactone acylase PvdQ
MRRYLALPQADPGHVVFEIVRAAAAGGERGGWTDGEAVTAAVRDSLRESWFRLSFRLGANRKKWRWGRLHPLRFRPFHARGRDGGGFAELGPVSYGGSGNTVNAAEYDPAEPFEVRVASTFRFAVDTSAFDRALAALAPGQSEHPGHRNFSDGLERWLEGRPGPLGTARPRVGEASGTRLVLEAAP